MARPARSSPVASSTMSRIVPRSIVFARTQAGRHIRKQRRDKVMSPACNSNEATSGNSHRSERSRSGGNIDCARSTAICCIHQGLINATITRVHQRQEELENAERIHLSSAPDRQRCSQGGQNFPDSMSSSKTRLFNKRDYKEFCRTWPNQTEVTVKGIRFVQEEQSGRDGRGRGQFHAHPSPPIAGQVAS